MGKKDFWKRYIPYLGVCAIILISGISYAQGIRSSGLGTPRLIIREQAHHWTTTSAPRSLVFPNNSLYVSGNSTHVHILTSAVADNLYLKLDQSTPQTVTGGAPSFAGGLAAGSTSQLTVDASGNVLTSGTLGAGAITGTSLTDSGLTITRIPYATTGGLLTDSSTLTYSDTTGLNTTNNIQMANGGTLYIGTSGTGSRFYDDVTYSRTLFYARSGQFSIVNATGGSYANLQAAGITGTSFIIGANTLTTSEWAFLDGINQTVATTSSPQFVNLTLTGGATLGDTTSDIHGINTAPVSENMLTASFLTSNANTTTYFIKGTQTASGNNTASKTVYGYYLDQNLSGTDTNNDFIPFSAGIYLDIDDTSTVNHSSAVHTLYGIYTNINYQITNTANNTLVGYGSYVDIYGNLGTTGNTSHYGNCVFVAGTADTNYGIYITSGGATTNWSVYINTGNVFLGKDNILTYWGTGFDATISYNATDLVIAPDVVGTGRLVIDTGTAIGQEAVMVKQDDADQAFINYQGTSGANLSNNISTFTTEGGTVGYIKIEINGVAYWFRACTAPTA